MFSCAAVTPMGWWYDWSGTDALVTPKAQYGTVERHGDVCGTGTCFILKCPYFLRAQDLLPITPYAYRTLPSWTLGHVQLKIGIHNHSPYCTGEQTHNRALWQKRKEWYQRGGEQRKVKKIEPQRNKREKNWKKFSIMVEIMEKNEGQAPFLNV